MKRALLLSVAAAAALGFCARALAAVTASGQATVTIQDAAGVNIVTPLVLPTVSAAAVVSSSAVSSSAVSAISGGGAAFGSRASAVAGRGVAASNATLTIYGQSGDAVSMAVPQTFQVIRTGGTEALTVKTNTNAEYNVGGNGVVVGGQNAESMSVNVGGALSLASADDLVPGPYEGLLVVVVQYN